MFREENAFLSSLPLLCLDKKLYERSKRNVLTSGVASCYPFTSYEMSDKDGIMMGVNKANNSLVIVDIFNTKIYKNANIAILGTSGAGKTFTMQLMALRLRRKNTVYRYRRASGKLLVKETEELRKTMDEILSEIIKEWDGYEQVFKNG